MREEIILMNIFERENWYEKEIDRLMAENNELRQVMKRIDSVNDLMFDVLCRTAHALKGEPKPLEEQKLHDLPDIAQKYKTALELIAQDKIGYGHMGCGEPTAVAKIAQESLEKQWPTPPAQ